MCRQGTAVAGLKRLQPLSPVAAQRLVAGDALAEQQALDAIDVAHALVDQGLALTRDTATVLFLGRRHPDHRTHPWLASLIGQQRPDQRLAVDLVGLARRRRREVAIEAGSTTWLSIPSACSTRSIRSRQARLPGSRSRKAFPGPRLRLALELGKPRQHAGDIAGRDRMLRHLRAATRRQRGDQPIRALNSKETKIAPRSVRIVAGASGRSCNGHAWPPRWVSRV